MKKVLVCMLAILLLGCTATMAQEAKAPVPIQQGQQVPSMEELQQAHKQAHETAEQATARKAFLEGAIWMRGLYPKPEEEEK